MPPRSRKRRSAKPNRLWVVVAIIIVIAIITMIVSYFYLDEDKPDVLLLPPTEQQDSDEGTDTSTAPVSQIDGTWVSNYDGAILTLRGDSFSLEISGVDETEKIEGSLAIESNIVTFVYVSGTEVCKGPEGHYLYSIEDNGDIFFKLIKDICDSRKERMTATWFKL